MSQCFLVMVVEGPCWSDHDNNVIKRVINPAGTSSNENRVHLIRTIRSANVYRRQIKNVQHQHMYTYIRARLSEVSENYCFWFYLITIKATQMQVAVLNAPWVKRELFFAVQPEPSSF